MKTVLGYEESFILHVLYENGRTVRAAKTVE